MALADACQTIPVLPLGECSNLEPGAQRPAEDNTVFPYISIPELGRA